MPFGPILESGAMGYARSEIVDPHRSGVYHCVSRCVRREPLIASPRRCAWIVSRLEHLCRVFAIDVCDFAVMRNHVHLLLRTHPDLAWAWSDEETATRWLSRRGAEPDRAEVAAACRNRHRIDEWRRRLSDLGWFHKLWKEPAAKSWNREDEMTGHFWEGRYRSHCCRDEESVLMQATYILLNPVHCGAETFLHDSPRTSMGRRIKALANAIRAGHMDTGVAKYRSALLEPAIPCDPGPDAPILTDSQWCRRLAERAHERFMREATHSPERPSPFLAGGGLTWRTITEDESPPDSPSEPASSIEKRRPPAPGSTSPGRDRPEAGLAKRRFDRSHPRRATSIHANPWKGKSSLPIIRSCSLLAFIAFVDERSRIPRIDKPGFVPRESPKVVDLIHRSARCRERFALRAGVDRPSQHSDGVPLRASGGVPP
jgi:hypothetical protein